MKFIFGSLKYEYYLEFEIWNLEFYLRVCFYLWE